jgi:hypothetical protein
MTQCPFLNVPIADGLSVVWQQGKKQRVVGGDRGNDEAIAISHP